jgi:hypothetical protein
MMMWLAEDNKHAVVSKEKDSEVGRYRGLISVSNDLA